MSRANLFSLVASFCNKIDTIRSKLQTPHTSKYSIVYIHFALVFKFAQNGSAEYQNISL